MHLTSLEEPGEVQKIVASIAATSLALGVFSLSSNVFDYLSLKNTLGVQPTWLSG